MDDFSTQAAKVSRTGKSAHRFRWLLIGSLVVHAGVSLLTFLPQARPRVIAAPSAKDNTRFYPASFFLRGGVRAPDQRKPVGRKRHLDVPPKPNPDLARNEEPTPAQGAPVATNHDPVPGNGSDASNAQPAFPVFSPRPAVRDRSLLPSSDQQVIVDVKVSALGEVLEATLVHGLGNALDTLVLDTVKTWKFHPATVDGSPVATESELIFPFSQSYPTTPS